MAEYSYPGVYGEEKKFGTPPVTGGSTSTAAFVGYAPRGEVGVPTLVTSWTDFVNQFSLGAESPYLKNAYLAYAVYGFFNNGGKRLWVVRATDGTDKKAKISVTNGSKPIVFEAKDSGTWANQFSVKIVPNADFASKYDVQISKDGEVVETHRQLGFGEVDEPYHFAGTINANSKYITVETDADTIETGSLNAAQSLAGGEDGLTSIQDSNLIGAMKKLSTVDSINILVMPESQSQGLTTEAEAYAHSRKATFIGDGELNATLESIQQFKQLFASDFMTLYYPWGEIVDPIGTVKKTKFIPIAGHVAGVYARIDTERGVFKAPAGTEAGVRGLIGLKTTVNDEQQGILNPKGINVIRAFADTGIVIWGARTTAGNYVNVRRELNYIMDAILSSTKWAVFEPNNTDLWRRIRNATNSFLRGRYALGAYRGASEEEAFFVKCDGELNTLDEINAGRVNSEIGVAINKPGEFIIFRVGQWDGGGSAQ